MQRFLDSISNDEFYENVEKQDAVLRRLEIIGEAVKVCRDISTQQIGAIWIKYKY